MRIYYAHCKAIYGTEQEKQDIHTLELLGFEVINPSDKKHSAGWAAKSMKYADELITKCDALAFRRLPDGRIPAGVGYEVILAQNWRLPVIELPEETKNAMFIEDTREYIKQNAVN